MTSRLAVAPEKKDPNSARSNLVRGREVEPQAQPFFLSRQPRQLLSFAVSVLLRLLCTTARTAKSVTAVTPRRDHPHVARCISRPRLPCNVLRCPCRHPFSDAGSVRAPTGQYLEQGGLLHRNKATVCSIAKHIHCSMNWQKRRSTEHARSAWSSWERCRCSSSTISDAQTASDGRRRTIGDHHATLQTHQHVADLQPSCRRLGKTARRRCRSQRHARPSPSSWACAQVWPAKLENQTGRARTKRIVVLTELDLVLPRSILARSSQLLDCRPSAPNAGRCGTRLLCYHRLAGFVTLSRGGFD